MTPLSHWIWFHVAIVALLALEYLLHLAVPNTKRKAIYATILWVAAALSLAAVLVRFYTSAGAVQYLAGYAIEEALSIDNLFVFLLLFRLFRIPEVRQPRVLFWGVAGAIVMRGAFIAAGLGLLHRFHWISYAFGAILLFGAIRLLRPENPNDATQTPGWIRWLSTLSPISESQDHFFVRQNGRVMGTILLLALVAVELTDIVFALDSIPAVLSITRQPFLAYTSNIMAVMGLRSLYVLLAAMLAKLRFLHFGLAAVLAFAAIKMLLGAWIEIGPLVSLAVIAGLLSVTIGASLLFTRPATQPISS
ncbi:TerC/Alx family metal homeostasis membrane protein [Granulicella mallensis]|uniref:Tellurite resistance protein TerC n=1 Tax=Granulicella mallensis TaxID=940614 RepID=A0A7W8EA12_9BACT|nr:TerC/Alx family metal homeostasis membrane protein [Granulicella mallensis]MBB5064261.1 tellurite resistance protein TerC [Granulicella mallensis]